MARAGVRRSAWLICGSHSFHAVSPKLAMTATLPAHPAARTITEMAEFSSAAAYFLICSRRFGSNVKASDSGIINLGEKDNSHTELKALLKSYGFSEVQINEFVKRYPKILSCRVSTNLKPKLDYLVECGFSVSALHRVIASNPYIFERSLNSFLKPRYSLLKTHLKDEVNEVIMRDSQLLSNSYVETNFEYLKKQGVPVSSITKLLAREPRVLRHIKNRIVKWVEATKELGIEPGATMFPWYIWMFGSMGETSWKKKLEVFKSLGWSDEDIKAMLLHYPSTFRVSEEKLRRNMDFYIKNVKTEHEHIIRVPKLLGMSLNGRIIPRYEVMKLLKEYKLLKSHRASTFFLATEKRFVRRYIEKNIEQIPHLLQVYHDSKKVKADVVGLVSRRVAIW